MRHARPFILFAVAAGALGLASCGRGDGRKPTFPVTGKVLLPDGKPAAHATVVLHPVDTSAADVRPHGKVAPDGTFRVGTYGADDGAPAGEYRVTVELYLASPRADEGPSNRLNPRYAKPEASGLTAHVGGPTELKTIELRK